jgi:hypothetical protein
MTPPGPRLRRFRIRLDGELRCRVRPRGRERPPSSTVTVEPGELVDLVTPEGIERSEALDYDAESLAAAPFVPP